MTTSFEIAVYVLRKESANATRNALTWQPSGRRMRGQSKTHGEGWWGKLEVLEGSCTSGEEESRIEELYWYPMHHLAQKGTTMTMISVLSTEAT